MKSLFKFIGLAGIGLCALSHADTQATSTPAPVITPSAGPRVENAIDAVVTADFIYLYAAQTGMDFALNNFAGTEFASQGSIYYPNFKFVPGFRVGFGLDFAHDGWDVMADYTYLHSGTYRTNNSFAPTTVLTFDNVIDQNPILTATSAWRMKLDVIDLDLGRNYFISQYLALRPFFGAKAVWNRQLFNTGNSFEESSVTQLVSMNQTQSAFGIGLRTGMDTSWQFDRNWNIFGNAAFSLLSSTFKNQAKITEGTASSTSYRMSTAYEQNTVQPVVELAMGFGYDCFFDDDNYHFGIQAGWEFQYWNNNNYFGLDVGTSQTVNDPQDFMRYGDLSLQGFDLKLRLDF